LLAAALFFVPVAGLVPPSGAQAQDANEGDVLEEVIIVGSRIRQDPLEQRLPVLTLSNEDYLATGATSLAEFVQKLPISGSAINQTNNSSGNLGFPPDGGGIGAGAAEVDLRYLTSKRVLVLVDGRRWIKGSSGSGVSGAVDLNSIPVNAVKSIEILQDGASAVYGSDAIGGVLNIVTVDDFDGMKASAYYGQYDESDGETLEVDVRMGGGAGGRARGLIDVSFADQKSVNTADREESVYPLPGFPYGISSGTPAGRFVFLDPTVGDFVSVAPNAGIGDSPVWDPSNPDADDFHPFALEDRFNYQPFNHLVTPNRRLNIFGKAEYDLNDTVTLRLLASYNNRESQGRAAPVPLFFGPGGGSTFYMTNLFWPADHPYNPFGVDLDPNNLDFIGRRPIEAGPRIFNQDVDTWYVSAGVDGVFSIGSRNMYWDVTAIWADNSATQTKLNQFNARRLYTALGPPDVCAANVGCVPLNIVGAGSMTQEMLDYVTYTGIDSSSQDLFDFTANLAGDLFDLPAGPLGFALGIEHREENGNFVPDPVVVAGETADVPTNPTSGGFDVDEVYGEVIVPIIADRAGFHVLNVSAALRYSDYDLFDSETVSKLALNWGPTENLMLRASFSEGFRAPNIGELFNLGSRFDAGITDRCSNVAPEDAANCAALGVPPDYVQLNPQISVDTGGNRDLQPETSDTYAFGFTWDTPVGGGFIDRFLVEANYYDIEIDGAIQPPVAQDLLNACIETLEDIYCSAVNRLPTGTITSIEGTLQNIGGIETSGVDINLDMDLAENAWGGFGFQWLTSFLLDYDELIPNAEGSFDRISRDGTEVGSPVRGYPELRSTLNTDWMLGDWFARLSFRYLSSLTENCQGLVADFGQTQLCSNGPDTNTLGSRLYTDAQVSWRPSRLNGGAWTFTLGVNNLFDERPPICFSCDLNSLDGTLYPIGGSFWYLRAIFEM
jgi:iron complex outermembrane receptor protein